MFETRKVHNMLYFMLDPQYKNVCFMYFFIGLQEGIEVVRDYDKRSQCWENVMNTYIHYLFAFLNNSQSNPMDIDVKCSLDIF